ncbi:MAG TPA: YbaL family putative K(+) efflux transporter [Allosphingosinicella sp.]|nr:YbaL family putative K(+) efflux transporter [Allosphingosinicella sp.]
MPHHTPLIGTIVAGLVIAFAMGALAHRLKLPPILGYLLAGVIVGPFTPGFVADGNLAAELAEIGVILLMFGVGLHFSLKDLLSVRRIAVPGAIVQIGVATLMGLGLALAMGWTVGAGLVFGLSLSVASTVVLLRALQSRGLVETEKGRIAVGWLIVEDLAMVLALVLIPAFASAGGTGWDLAGAVGAILLKVVGFIALMLIVGRRAIPWLLHWVAHSGSRELFRLAVLAVALGVAFGAALAFQVSFALGAFFAGMILGETQLSRRATEETLPLRDAFAVLFFVSVGMLFDPKVIVAQPGPLLATVAIIVFGKSVAAYLIVRLFRHPTDTALAVSASLAQIGEFSFILASLGTGLNILPAEGRDLILAGAILSILINPFLFGFVAKRSAAKADAAAAKPAEKRPGHVLLVGYGRVGRRIAAGLKAKGRDCVIIEDQGDIAEEAEADGLEVVRGNAAEGAVLLEAGIDRAAKLLVAIPGGYEAGAITEKARSLVPGLPIVARAHSDEEVAHLERLGARHVVMAERVAAEKMLELAAPGAGKGRKP